MANASSFEDLPVAGVEGIHRKFDATLGFGHESFYGDFSQTFGEQCDIHSLLPKMEFPIFDGSHPRMWITQCNIYFKQLPRFSDVQRIDLAIWNFEGRAFSWILELPIDDVLVISWIQFCELVCTRFDMLKVSKDDDALIMEIEFEETSYSNGGLHQGENSYERQSDYFSRLVYRGELDLIDKVIDMYSKCGGMTNARRVLNFGYLLINGHAAHGLGVDGLTLFEQMKTKCVTQIGETFLAILEACANVDAIEEGFIHLESNKNDDIIGIATVKKLEELGNVLTSWDPGDSIVVASSILMISKCQGRTMVSYYVLLNAVAEQLLDRLEDCTKLFPSTLCMGGPMGAIRRLLNGRGGIEKLLMMNASVDIVSAEENSTNPNVETSFVAANALILSGESAIGPFGEKALSVLRMTIARMELCSREENRQNILLQNNLRASLSDQIEEQICHSAAEMEFAAMTDAETFNSQAAINQFLSIMINTFYSNKEIFLRKMATEDLETVVVDLRTSIRKELIAARIKYIAGNIFSYYDQVFNTTAMLGDVPPKYNWTNGEIGLSTYFSIARGNAFVLAMEMAKWFDTNYHFIVSELDLDVEFSYASHKAVNKYNQATALGVDTVQVLLGHVSYLLLSEFAMGVAKTFPLLSLLDNILPIYKEVVYDLKAVGDSWIQFDESTLVVDLEPHTFSSLYPRGRGSSSGGGSVMAYVDMDYDGDGVKKERSMLVGAGINLVKHIDNGMKYICCKFSSSDPRGRGSYQPGGIVMAHESSEKG